MTSKERLVAAMEGEQFDHRPFAPFLAYFWEAQPAAVRAKGQLAFLKEIGADQLWRCAPGIASHQMQGVSVRTSRKGEDTRVVYETPVGSISERYRRSDIGNTEYLVEHAVRRTEDFRVLAWMEEHTRVYADATRMHEHLSGDGAEGLSLGNPLHVRQGGLIKTAFQQLVEHWVGTEQLIYTLEDDPDLIDMVLAPMREADRSAVEISASLDEYDYFLTFEDSSTQNYSPAMYERFIVPEISQWQSILSRAGKTYVQHACGHVSGILRSMGKQDIWGIESLTPPETGDTTIAHLRDVMGDGFGVIGGIEPVALERLPVSEIPTYLDRVLSENGTGKLVLANGDSCPPGVTVDKLVAIAKHVREVARTG